VSAYDTEWPPESLNLTDSLRPERGDSDPGPAPALKVRYWKKWTRHI